eukprot:m.474677 g.474677  ORF g.474677 m.474677 type:complete len:353 (-) comp21678_c0_seq10:155-1213(-)
MQRCRRGTLLFADGVFLTGPFHLPKQSSIILITANATVRAAPMKWWVPSGWQGTSAFIEGANVSDLVLCGTGTIDGQGAPWWAAVHNDLQWRPGLMGIASTTNFRLCGWTFLNSPNHNIFVANGVGVHVANINVTAPHDSKNTDGINFSGGNDQVIENSFISNGDDCVSIVPSSSWPTAGVDLPCGGNVVVRNMQCIGGHGVSIGSIRHGHVSNVTVENVTFVGGENGCRIKTYPNNTGLVENVFYGNITLTSNENPILIDGKYCPKSQKPYPCPQGSHAVVIRNVTFENIVGSGTGDIVGTFDCSSLQPCTDITLQNINLTSTRSSDPQFSCTNVTGEVHNVHPTACLVTP